MNSARLLSILVAILVGAVLVGFLISMKGKPPLRETSPTTSEEPSPRPSPLEGESSNSEPDLRGSLPLGKEEVSPLYTALQNKADNFKSAHIRTRLEFVGEKKDSPPESEFWFDAIRPDHFMFKALVSGTRKDKDGTASSGLFPYRAEIRTGTQFLVINYVRKKVYITDLDGFDKASGEYASSMLVQSASRMINPLQDLISRISYEDRLKEMLEAKREKTSQGEEIHVLFRITGSMSRALKNRHNLAYLPIGEQALNLISLRKDIFDSATGNLKQTVYLDSEWHPFLIQTYSELEWDGEIPADRFLPDAPPGSVATNMSQRVSYLHRLGITRHDMEEFRRAGNTSSPTAVLDLIRQKEREKGLEPSN